jgi:hypothetical protein
MTSNPSTKPDDHRAGRRVGPLRTADQVVRSGLSAARRLTVLLFSAESWAQTQSDLGAVPPGERTRESPIWRTAVPLAEDGHLLTSDPNRPGAVSFYRATRNERRAAFEFRVGTVSRSVYDEVVWENGDDRCHLTRYFSGALRCVRVKCDDSCSGGIEVDPKTGAQSLPCGRP